MKTLKSIIESKGYKLYADESVLNSFPRSEKNRGKVEVFKLDKYMTNDEVIAEYAKRGLVPATADELLSVEKDYDYVATIDGNCYLTFGRWCGARGVSCRRSGSGWFDGWFLSGVPAPRKSSDLESSALLSDTLSLDRALEIVKEAGYEVTPLTLEKKIRDYFKNDGILYSDEAIEGLVEVATKHFNV